MSYFNPEFQRNLWLELSSHKLIATPLMLFAVLYLGYLTGNEWETVIKWSVWCFTVLTIVYGAYLAGDSLADEVQDHTWAAQRLTALTPWTMTWGKALGGTVYAWYIGLCCLIAMLIAVANIGEVDKILIVHAKPWLSVVYLIGIAICFHAFALMLTLVQLQKTNSLLRRTIFAPVVALIFAILYAPYLLHKLPSESVNVIWYHLSIPEFQFSLLSIYINMAWFMCGAYMLMRRELQFINNMLVWLAFLTYQCAYFIGFTYGFDEASLPKIEVYDQRLQLPMMSFRVGIVFLILHAATYAMAAIEKVDVVAIRQAWQSHLTGRVKLLLDVSPRWLPTLLLTVMSGCVLLLTLQHEGYFESKMAVLIFALLAFMLRDVGLFALFDISGKRRQVITAMMYLLLLYLVIPAILKLLGMSFLMPWFYPRPDYSLIYAVGAPLLQAGYIAVLVYWRFRQV